MNADDEEQILETIALAAQHCVQQHPVVVLGSGASVAHGLRGMGALALYLQNHIKLDEGEEADSWLQINTALTGGDGLEEALLKIAAPPSLVEKIVTLTWQAIAEDDLDLMSRAACGHEHFCLSDLLRKMFKSTHIVTNIVTPNYDRVVEYASDIAGYIHTTGFAPGIIRNREGDNPLSFRYGSHPARTVRIWKVHGSLDWFADNAGRVVSLPFSERLPKGFKPLIVTPGVSKFERTYDEPFRSAIRGSDSALNQATSFLCVGYGFRDRHIEPRMVNTCRIRNVPIVILAHTLTDEAKRFLAESAGKSYMALESDGEGTRVFLPEHPKGIRIAQPNLWSFDSFNKMAL